MKYKVGDKVRIKSLDWYNRHTNGTEVNCKYYPFSCHMKKHCGQLMTISVVGGYSYSMIEDDNVNDWTDEMIEGLVEDGTKYGTASNPIEIKSNANCLTRERVDELATKIDKELPSGNQNIWELPDGYQFVDENGNVINATKIVLEKKKNEYPKTYEECRDYIESCHIEPFCADLVATGYKSKLIESFARLLICRDAYWKIAGEEMGLGKPWEPDYTNAAEKKFAIWVDFGEIKMGGAFTTTQMVLSFPTEEVRDAFYENFKEEIEKCKELL